MVSDIKNQSKVNMFTCFNERRAFGAYKREDLCFWFDNRLSFIIGFGISISSLVFGLAITILFKYNYQIKVYLFSKNWCLWWVKEKDIDRDKKYDIFLSFCHEDEKFVFTQIVPQLEEGENPYRVCIHLRDWEIGEWIHKNIDNSVKESRRTVIIMSQSFLRSPWGLTEFRIAYQEMLSEKRVRMIVVKYGDIGSSDNLEDDLKLYLQSNTIADWDDPYFWRKFRYSLPHSLDL